MTMSKRLKLAITLAPVLGALAIAFPAAAAPTGGSGQHFSGAHGDFHGDRDHGRRGFGRGFGFGFGFGYWDPWWWWDPAAYWGYPYPYPYYYPYAPYPAYYAPPGPAPEGPVQPTGAPPPQYWYYCDNPQGYYPQVANCSSAWRQVGPTAPQSGNTVSPKPQQ